MMLQALAAYAERRMAQDPDFFDPDFRWENAAWRIEVSQGGILNGVIPLKIKEGKKWQMKRVHRPYTDVNEISVRSLEKARSYFLCDTIERVLLYADRNVVSTDPLIHARARFFCDSIKAAANAGAAPRLAAAIVKFLCSESEVDAARRKLSEFEADPKENVVFGVEGIDVIAHPEMVAYWRRQRLEKSKAVVAHRSICLVTGEISDCVSTANKIKGIGGQDTILISSNEQAFCSFGLEKATNSPISIQAEGRVKAALDDLIQKSKRQKLVFNETIHLHWTRNPIEQDPFDLLSTPDEQAVAALILSAKEGTPLAGIDVNAYYALSLSANGARLVVRDWLESTVPEIKANIANWFQHLTILDPDQNAIRRDFSLWGLLATLVPRKENKPDFEKLSPQSATELLYAALNGGTLPLTILAAALRRQQVEFKKSGEKFDPKLNSTRMALIKACLLRSPNLTNHNPQPTNTPMSESLNSESHDPAYLCGRLFAVFDRLQYLALGGVNAGVVERYYASASTTPALVMGRLFRNAQFHLAKTEGGVTTNVTKDFEAITAALGDQFPAALDLEGQGRFALGYYHQKAEYRRRSAERKEPETTK